MVLEVITKRRVFNRGPKLDPSKVYIRGGVHKSKKKESFYYLFLIGSEVGKKCGLSQSSKVQVAFDNQNPLIRIAAGKEVDFACSSDRGRPGFLKVQVSKEYLNSLYLVAPSVDAIFEIKPDGLYLKMHKKDYGQKEAINVIGN